MRRKSLSRSVKEGGGKRRVVRLVQLLGVGTVYITIFVCIIVIALFMYSFFERIQQREPLVSKEEDSHVNTVAEHQTIRVEILNGAGVQGIAQRMTNFLRREGFDVLNFGNAEHFTFYETIVLDRIGNRAAAERVARTVNTENILEQKNPYLALDVTLILGRDFSELNPFQKERR